MDTRGTEVAVRLSERAVSAPAIKAIRKATGMGIADIRRAADTESPIVVGHVCSLTHEEAERRISILLAELADLQVEFDLVIDGETETREYYRNICARWIEIGEDTQMETDLQLGEPTIETLERLRQRGTEDVFQTTISQIVAGDGYTVDDETMAWAKRHLTSA